jgi:pentatricopeptide repeat protein
MFLLHSFERQNGLCDEKKRLGRARGTRVFLNDAPLMSYDYDGYRCTPTVVWFNTVVDDFYKQGEVGKACSLFHQMLGSRISTIMQLTAQ